MFGLFPSGGAKKKCATFCTNRLKVPQGMSAEFFAQKIEDLTCVCMVNTKQNIAKNIDPRLEKTKTEFSFKFIGNNVSYSLSCTKVQISTPFLRYIDADTSRTCSVCPSQDLTSVLFFSFPFLSRKMFGLRWSKFCENLTSRKTRQKREKKKTTGGGEVFAMARGAYAKFHGLNRTKRYGHSPGNTFPAFNLNQPVVYVCTENKSHGQPGWSLV